MSLLVGQCLQDVHFMKKKMRFITIEEIKCIEELCKKLKEQAMKIINYEEKEMIPLTKEENNFYDEQEICYICKDKVCMDKNDKNYINKRKVKDHCHYTGIFGGAAHDICDLNYNVQKQISNNNL